MTGLPSSDISVTLTHDEALVLFDLTQRLETEAALETIAKDKAELITLWSLTAALEPLIDDAFSSRYGELLAAAKQRLTADSEGAELS
jgi:hypothetical protein